MDIKLKDNKPNIRWEDLNAGDVFLFAGCWDTENALGMKVVDAGSDVYPREFLLDLKSFELYGDVENYKIIRVINCVLEER